MYRVLGKRTSKTGFFRRAIRFGARYSPAIGRLIGGPVGAAISAVGPSAFSALGRVTGLGAYKLHGGRIGAGNQVPAFNLRKPTTEGGCVITHREYIQDISSGASGTPSAFSVTGFAINPGNPALFPWLSTIAANFEQYKLHGMLFHYRTTSGNSVASTSTSLGAVILATEYNAGAPLFTSKSQMENYAHGQSGVPSEDIVHEIECQRAQTTVSQPYVRGDQIPNGQDPRLYDFGIFQIATQGMPANEVVLGELWCTYCVELIKPKIPAQVSTLNVPVDHFILNSGAVSTAHYFGNPGTTPVVPDFGTLGSTIQTISSLDYLLLPGYGMAPGTQLPLNTVLRLDYFVKGASTTLTSPTSWAVGANWSVKNILLGGSFMNADAGETGSIQWIIKVITKTGINQYGDYAYVNAGTLPGSISAAALWVSILPTTMI